MYIYCLQGALNFTSPWPFQVVAFTRLLIYEMNVAVFFYNISYRYKYICNLYYYTLCEINEKKRTKDIVRMHNTTIERFTHYTKAQKEIERGKLWFYIKWKNEQQQYWNAGVKIEYHFGCHFYWMFSALYVCVCMCVLCFYCCFHFHSPLSITLIQFMHMNRLLFKF